MLRKPKKLRVCCTSKRDSNLDQRSWTSDALRAVSELRKTLGCKHRLLLTGKKNPEAEGSSLMLSQHLGKQYPRKRLPGADRAQSRTIPDSAEPDNICPPGC